LNESSLACVFGGSFCYQGERENTALRPGELLSSREQQVKVMEFVDGMLQKTCEVHRGNLRSWHKKRIKRKQKLAVKLHWTWGKFFPL